jgi:hypothetical protein
MIGAQALQDATNCLTGTAIFKGEQRTVFVRLAELASKIYLDLGDQLWRAVEIDTSGWRLIDRPPVRFRRAKATLPLPVPIAGGSLATLRTFVNVTDEDWPLILSWLLAALMPKGPFLVLFLHGEQGAAKSTVAKVLRSLVDPNSSPVRAEPREARDLAIAANNSWVIGLDNLSYVQPWLSDALCRLSTGGGFATRTLFENDEESIFDAQRPIVINGIEDLATRGDLLDRALLVSLPRIADERRKTETEFWKAFEAAKPAILGALLDTISVGLRELPAVKLACLPRMADFATWIAACEPALGWEPGAFLAAYQSNRKTANEASLESSPVARCIIELVPEAEWQGTAQELLTAIEARASESERRLRIWPKTPRALSGALRRLAPSLRASGLYVDFARPSGANSARTVIIHRVERSSDSASQQSQPSHAAENTGFSCDGRENSTVASESRLRRKELAEHDRRDGCEAGDARIKPHSSENGSPNNETHHKEEAGCDAKCDARKPRPSHKNPHNNRVCDAGDGSDANTHTRSHESSEPNLETRDI